jgi:hypothetical protein
VVVVVVVGASVVVVVVVGASVVVVVVVGASVVVVVVVGASVVVVVVVGASVVVVVVVGASVVVVVVVGASVVVVVVVGASVVVVAEPDLDSEPEPETEIDLEPDAALVALLPDFALLLEAGFFTGAERAVAMRHAARTRRQRVAECMAACWKMPRCHHRRSTFQSHVFKFPVVLGADAYFTRILALLFDNRIL